MSAKPFSEWTVADVAAHNARIRGTGEKSLRMLMEPLQPKAAKAHKYRAEPCIVTADLTLFTEKDIEQAETALPIGQLGSLFGSLKSRAQACGIIGEWFGSTKEGRRWIELKQLESARKIFRLQRQPAYRLCAWTTGKGDSMDALPALGEYRADFRYCNTSMCVCAWGCTIEDVKGLKTAMYKWKKKHAELQYGITIRET